MTARRRSTLPTPGHPTARSTTRRLALALVLLAVLATELVGVPAEARRPVAPRPDACGKPVAKGRTYWRCTFVDNFNGTRLDPTRWVMQDTALTGYHNGETCFDKVPQRARVGGGLLKLTVVRTSTPFTCQSPFGGFSTSYSGADISTWGRFSQAFGRFEARIKYDVAKTAGVHSNFWMNPQHLLYGSWPGSGEIDVAEWFSNRPDHSHPSLHYPGRTQADTGWYCRIGRADVFHTYTMEWTRHSMKFLYDGKLCYERSWSPTIPMLLPQPFDQPFYISLTQSGWGNPGASYPAHMTVDYVRAWA